MKDCIFCKIAKGEIESVKIWENKKFLAILDIQPIVKGMTVVFPKKHYNSKVFEMPEKIYQEFLLATKDIANLLKEKLNAKRVFMVIEGLDVNHAHIKLYPVKKEKPLGQLIFENRNNPIKKLEELKQLAKEIKN